MAYHKEGTFQPIRLAVAEKIANDQDREHEKANHEDLKIEIHRLAHGPGDDDNEWAVEEGCLDGWAETMVQRDINHTIST